MKKIATLVICAALLLPTLANALPADKMTKAIFAKEFGEAPTKDNGIAQLQNYWQSKGIDVKDIRIHDKWTPTPQIDSDLVIIRRGEEEQTVMVGWGINFQVKQHDKKGKYTGSKKRTAYFQHGDLFAVCNDQSKFNNDFTGIEQGKSFFECDVLDKSKTMTVEQLEDWTFNLHDLYPDNQ